MTNTMYHCPVAFVRIALSKKEPVTSLYYTTCRLWFWVPKDVCKENGLSLNILCVVCNTACWQTTYVNSMARLLGSPFALSACRLIESSIPRRKATDLITTHTLSVNEIFHAVFFCWRRSSTRLRKKAAMRTAWSTFYLLYAVSVYPRHPFYSTCYSRVTPQYWTNSYLMDAISSRLEINK